LSLLFFVPTSEATRCCCLLTIVSPVQGAGICEFVWLRRLTHTGTLKYIVTVKKIYFTASNE
jgi:hypothetical protein